MTTILALAYKLEIHNPDMSLRSIHTLGRCSRPLTTASRSSSTVQEVSQNKPVIPSNSTVFSMIQPTGRIHLGNYLGAVKSWRTLSESNTDPSNRFIYGIADLHAITIPKDPIEFKEYRYAAIASLIASGLDTSKCILFSKAVYPNILN